MYKGFKGIQNGQTSPPCDGIHQAKAKKKETAACKAQRLHGMAMGCIPGYGLRVDAPKFIFRSPE